MYYVMFCSLVLFQCAKRGSSEELDESVWAGPRMEVLVDRKAALPQMEGGTKNIQPVNIWDHILNLYWTSFVSKNCSTLSPFGDQSDRVSSSEGDFKLLNLYCALSVITVTKFLILLITAAVITAVFLFALLLLKIVQLLQPCQACWRYGQPATKRHSDAEIPTTLN